MSPQSKVSVKDSGQISRRLAKINILLLDGSVHVTTLFKNMLAEFGFTGVHAANNGLEGTQILRQIKINLIITDWELKVPYSSPEYDGKFISHPDILPVSGVDFVRRLRQSPSSPNPYIPVIMLASTVEIMLVNSARDAGVNEVCIKPLSARGLADKIMSVIERPRIFITADTYKGPCRRSSLAHAFPTEKERRKKEVRIIKFQSA